MTTAPPNFPPIGEVAELVATLPSGATGADLRRFRNATLMSRACFARFAGISRGSLKKYEDGNLPLSDANPSTRAAIALAIRRLGMRLTPSGWEKLPPEGAAK